MIELVLINRHGQWKLRKRWMNLPRDHAKLEAVARAMGVSRGFLTSEKRTKLHVPKRNLACLLMYDVYGLSNARVGRAMNRDQSTVHYAVHVARAALKRDPEFRERYERAKALLLEREAVAA